MTEITVEHLDRLFEAVKTLKGSIESEQDKSRKSEMQDSFDDLRERYYRDLDDWMISQ